MGNCMQVVLGKTSGHSGRSQPGEEQGQCSTVTGGTGRLHGQGRRRGGGISRREVSRSHLFSVVS